MTKAGSELTSERRQNPHHEDKRRRPAKREGTRRQVDDDRQRQMTRWNSKKGYSNGKNVFFTLSVKCWKGSGGWISVAVASTVSNWFKSVVWSILPPVTFSRTRARISRASCNLPHFTHNAARNRSRLTCFVENNSVCEIPSVSLPHFHSICYLKTIFHSIVFRFSLQSTKQSPESKDSFGMLQKQISL